MSEFSAVDFNRKGNHTRLFSCRKEENTMKEALKNLNEGTGRTTKTKNKRTYMETRLKSLP